MKKNGQIISAQINAPALFPQEKILLKTRTFWIVLILPILVTFLIGFAFVYGFTYFSLLFFSSISLALSSAVLAIAIVSSVITKILIDWQSHFYILTSHRVLEVCYKPLFSTYINNVILNQVKSTEIDIEGNGLINQLFNIGNVMITFDRPTHQEEFSLINIKNPKSVGFLFTEVLDSMKPDITEHQLWFKTKDHKHPLRFIEEIFPESSIAVN